MRVTTTTAGGPVATMPSNQVNAEFSHLIWTNFSGPDTSKNQGRKKKKNDLPSYLRGEQKGPDETTLQALERIPLGKNPSGGRGPKSDWNRLKKKFDQ